MSLLGKTILVLASMPVETAEATVENPWTDGRITNPWIETEEAIVSVIRAVADAGGRVAIIGDRISSLLAATVAGEYVDPAAAEGEGERRPAPVIIAGGEVDEELLALPASLGTAEIAIQSFGEIAESAAALVCIGSTSIRREVQLFRERNRYAPIFAFAQTGGATHELADTFLAQGVSFVDVEAAHYRPKRRQRDLGLSPEDEDEEDEHEFEYPAFSFAAQLIVERLEG